MQNVVVTHVSIVYNRSEMIESTMFNHVLNSCSILYASISTIELSFSSYACHVSALEVARI